MAWARKYRPQAFSDVIGHESVLRLLQTGITQSHLGTGLLFSGLHGTGKTTLARLVAMKLLCVDQTASNKPEPCQVCPSCHAFLSGDHVDFVEIDAASHTGVEAIRDLLSGSIYQPLFGRKKIFLIDEVHMLSKSAFHALLKTLEEPPAHLFFLFATTEASKIPATILSRCLHLILRPLSKELIYKTLQNLCLQENISYENQALQTIAEQARGSIRDAISLLEQAYLRSQNHTLLHGEVLQIGGWITEEACAKLLDLMMAQETRMLFSLLETPDYAFSRPAALIDQLAKLCHQRSLDFIHHGLHSSANSPDFSQMLASLGLIWKTCVQGLALIKESAWPHEARNMILLEALQGLQTLCPDSPQIQASHATKPIFSSACSSDGLSPDLAPSDAEEDPAPKTTSVPQQSPSTQMKIKKEALKTPIDPPSGLQSTLNKSDKQCDIEREVSHSHIHGPTTMELIPLTAQEAHQEAWLEKQDNPLKMKPMRDLPEEWLDLPFETWVSRISQAREELLAAHLQEDAICVALEPWRITLHVTPWVPKDFGSRLQSCLNHLTQRTWTVTCIQHTEPLENTLAQKERVSLEKQKERLMKHPTVQAWQKLFPSMTFHTLRISSFTETKGANHLI